MKEHAGEPEKRKQYVIEWSELIAKVRAEMEKGTPPENLDVKRLVELRKILTGGGDPEISQAAVIIKRIRKYQ